MKELLEMIESGADEAALARKVTELYRSGELPLAIEVLDAAQHGSADTLSLAGKFAAIYGDCETDRWYRAEKGFWIRKKNPTLFQAVSVYTDTANCFLCYFFEERLTEQTTEHAERLESACPVPDGVKNRELRRIYSLMRSKNLDDAKQKFATERKEKVIRWLNKYGIEWEDEK